MLNKNMLFYMLYFLSFLSLCYGVYINDYRVMFLSVFTICLFLILEIIVKKYKVYIPFFFKFCLFFFLFLSEILGEAFSFYSYIYWWDDMLHFICGNMVSYLGYFIFKKFIDSKKYLLLGTLFAFCFSLSFGVIWEFIEFGYDKYLGSDMQKDTVLDEFNTSYFGSTKNIQSISILKTKIYTDTDVVICDGYLDIGLIDTMNDLFVDVIGSMCICAIIYFYKKKTSIEV